MELPSSSAEVLKIPKHKFQLKRVIDEQFCAACSKLIAPNTRALVCYFCNILIHTNCRELVPPCKLMPDAEFLKGIPGTLQASAPPVPPYVPSLVVRLVKEVESRGMSTKGLYSMKADEKPAMQLLNKLMNNGQDINLNKININVIASTLKLFLLTLRKGLLINRNHYQEFEAAVENYKNYYLPNEALKEAVSKLPQANRDTLAFVMIHLQRVSESPACKMSKRALAIEFASVLVTKEANLRSQIAIVESLLKMPRYYWLQLISYEQLGSRSTSSPISTSRRSRWPSSIREEIESTEDANDEFVFKFY
ncbi:rac GTPase-activating protein 1-like [Venturia canescens]|uniref:rac GTPase-activating protein 1-like n=1 Tax=Venturia canescens TaxID=32260 RepID=UPI001C9D00C1|nr:rac GTPase-activating protein 1-like [Venturia canescens]